MQILTLTEYAKQIDHIVACKVPVASVAIVVVVVYKVPVVIAREPIVAAAGKVLVGIV